MSDREIFDKIYEDKDFREYVVMLFKLPPDDRERITDYIQWRYDHQAEYARERLKVVK